MSTSIQRRRGTTAEHATFAGLTGETTVDTTKNTVVVHNGSTAGGFPLMREDGSNSAFALGSAGTPAIKFTGDTNTGIYSPGADQVAISTNGTGRLFVNANGTVGIGATSHGNPNNYLLDIAGTGSQFIRSITTDTTATSSIGALRAEFLGGGGGANTSVELRAGNNYTYLTSTTNHALLFGTNTTERLRITSAGLVGVGTSSPDALLTVNGVGAHGLGSAAAPSFAFTGDLNTGLYSPGADQVAISTAGTGRLFVDASGNATIGAVADGLAASGQRLKVTGGTIEFDPGSGADSTRAFNFNIGTTNFAKLLVPSGSGGALAIHTGGVGAVSERARIDSSGRLLVGTSSNIGGTVSVAGGGLYLSANDSNAEMQLTRASANNGSPFYYFNKARGTYTSPTIVSDGDICGTINFRGHDGSAYIAGASITAAVDGTPGANDMPGRLVFSTTADGASSPTERMRIHSTGSVSVGTTAASANGANAGIWLRGDVPSIQVSRSGASCGNFYRLDSDGAVFTFSRDATQVGSISVTTTATAYNTSSDYRLKENVTAVADGITRLQQLKPSRFNFIADPSKTVDGFIAHEVQTVVPEAITGEKDAVDDEGNPEYQGIDQSKLVPLLTAALQEAIAKIESLEARLTAAGL